MSVEAEKRNDIEPAWLPYAGPTALFLIVSYFESVFPKWYPWIYALKVAIVALSLVVFRSTLRDIQPDARVVLPGVLVGLLIFAIWIPIDKLTASLHLPVGSRAAYNPFTAISNPSSRMVFIAVRLLGLSILIPIVEELFWRSFLLRFLSLPDGDFRRAPMGVFTWVAFWIVAVVFALAHPEWLSALICAIAYGLLLKQTRSLFATVVAHATTNLALGIYILVFHVWSYW